MRKDIDIDGFVQKLNAIYEQMDFFVSLQNDTGKGFLRKFIPWVREKWGGGHLCAIEYDVCGYEYRHELAENLADCVKTYAEFLKSITPNNSFHFNYEDELQELFDSACLNELEKLLSEVQLPKKYSLFKTSGDFLFEGGYESCEADHPELWGVCYSIKERFCGMGSDDLNIYFNRFANYSLENFKQVDL